MGSWVSVPLHVGRVRAEMPAPGGGTCAEGTQPSISVSKTLLAGMLLGLKYTWNCAPPQTPNQHPRCSTTAWSCLQERVRHDVSDVHRGTLG